MNVYVNLHPNYNYSTIIINDGYVEELKDYVKYVEWLNWDFSSIKGKPIIIISGANHIERVRVFLQRLLNKGADVFVRNNRSDEWTQYKPSRVFTVTEMVHMEQQRDSEPDELRWAKQNVEKYESFIERGKDIEPILNKMLKEAEENFEEAKKREQQRMDKVACVWK